MIYDVAKKMLVTGLGIAVFTKEKADLLINDWVKQGELSKDEGKELLDTWMKKIEIERDEVQTRIQKEIKRMVEQTGLVSKDDYNALAARVAVLEQRLEQVEKPEKPE